MFVNVDSEEEISHGLHCPHCQHQLSVGEFYKIEDEYFKYKRGELPKPLTRLERFKAAVKSIVKSWLGVSDSKPD